MMPAVGVHDREVVFVQAFREPIGGKALLEPSGNHAAPKS